MAARDPDTTQVGTTAAGFRIRCTPGGNSLRVFVLGEVAYAIGVCKSCLYLPDGGLRLSVNCTNVLHRRDGVWKLLHHHPDQAPPM